jgi:hypothetical protein
MNDKWYSLTRPAVVQFNPPRDKDLIGHQEYRKQARDEDLHPSIVD